MNQELLSQFNAKAKEVKEDMIDFAQRLIRTPSESGKEGDVAQVILAELKKLDFDEAYVDPIGNVIGIIKGTGDGPNILYNCHMDHVAPGNLDDWEYPPYSAEIADGWIHGRAASDTKGAMAPQVYAAYLIKACGVKLKGDIILTFVVYEEPGDMWGAMHLTDTLKQPIAFAVLGEATGLDVYLGHRGKIEIEVISRGLMSHSSAPRLGINAVSKMAPFIVEIDKLSKDLPTDEFLGQGTQSMIHISCQPGWGCTVPDVCQVNVDYRFLPEQKSEDILAQYRAVADKLKAADPESNFDIRIRDLDHTSYTGFHEVCPLDKPAYLVPTDNEYVVKTVDSLKQLGQEPKFSRWDFGTDGAWLDRKLGIPTIGYSCCEEVYAHRPNDRVSIEKMEKCLLGNIAISCAVCEIDA
ncbi:M20/M25/M40 family metallo-hydrolase [Anaerotruncus rubiinfantis]|uniref:M20/M25/M40 family metallo-hydrolase n=1 Tax=Anaerotruncus rubiinfantis TaxID=1720200 RepID=UPI000A55F1F8|nr:M20/M25/M40 family metallo-hydrolase [Anaerotruncus rubiinfantis]